MTTDADLHRISPDVQQLRATTLRKDPTMNTCLHDVIARFVGTVLLALAPVVFTAVISMPLTLGGHPGEAAQIDAPPRHTT